MDVRDEVDRDVHVHLYLATDEIDHRRPRRIRLSHVKIYKFICSYPLAVGFAPVQQLERDEAVPATPITSGVLKYF